MRSFIVGLVLLFCFLQYKLWFDNENLARVWHLRQAVAQQTADNTLLKQRNSLLEAEVNDLKSGQEAIEERARTELGMVKKGEQYYQVIEAGKHR